MKRLTAIVVFLWLLAVAAFAQNGPGQSTLLGTDQIIDGSITAPKLADDSVTTDKILDGAVTLDKTTGLGTMAVASTTDYVATGTYTTGLSGKMATDGSNATTIANLPVTLINGVAPLTAAEKTQALVGSTTVDILARVGKFSDGTAAAPSITFGSDPDTGIYKYSDGVVGIAGGGNAYARFANGALVFHASQTQISPSTSSGDDTGALLLGGGGGMGSTRGGSIWLYGNQLASGSIQMSCGNITGSTFSVFTGGASRMVITHPGNVLIGTTTDDGVNKLQVSGSNSFRFYSANEQFAMKQSSLSNGNIVPLEILIPTTTTQTGKLTLVSASNGTVADIGVSGGVTAIMSDPFSKIAITDTASKVCFLNDGDGTMSIKNNTGGSITFSIIWQGR